MPAADPETKLADAALKLLAKTRWSDLTLAQVARAARVPLASLQGAAPDKAALLGLILRRVGADVAKTYHPDRRSADTRDRLLDVALTWFEVLRPRAAAVRTLTEDLRHDPLSLISMRGEIVAAASWLLTLAEADTGASLPARALAFAGILARAIPVWLDDDGEMTATMARLDADLRRGGFLFGRPNGKPSP
jgi:AcrR family transcriptional regulator